MSDLLSTITHGNGLVTNAGYDLDYRLTSLQLLNGAAVVQGKTYGYADGMNLTSITDMVAPANNVALWHSPANRLSSADGPWGQTTFSYDPVGNRTYDVNTVALGFVDGPSVYVYAMNSPFMNADRDGRHITSDGTPNGPRIYVPLPGGLFLDMLIHNHPTDAQMCTVDDRYALKACLAAARGDEDAWHAYCGASGISPPVDFKRPRRCYRKTNESKLNRQGWCYNEFGNH